MGIGPFVSYYNVRYEEASMLFDIIICLYITLLYRKGSPTIRSFRKLAYMLTASTFIDILLAFVISSPDVSTWIKYAVHFANIETGTFSAVFFMQYMQASVGMPAEGDVADTKRTWISYLERGLLLLQIGLQLATPWTGWVLRFYEGSSAVTNGPLYFLSMYGFALYFLFAGTYWLLKNWKKYRLGKRIAVSISLFILFGILLTQLLLLPDVYMVFFAASLGLLALLFTQETPDYDSLQRTMAELSALGREAELARARALEANQAKSEFILNMSDKFRTPISGILGYTELTLENTDELQTREYAEKIRRLARGLLQIFNDVIAFSAADYETDHETRMPRGPVIEDQELFADYAQEWDDFAKEKEAALGKTAGQAADGTGAEKEFRVSGVRILSVDDNDMNQGILIKRLEKIGAYADQALSAESALAMLEHEHYDLVFMDHMMPDMDGIEALHTIRRRKLAQGVHIIAVTANIAEGDKQEYLAEGFDGYLAKPYSMQDLVSVLEKHLPSNLVEGSRVAAGTSASSIAQETGTVKEQKDDRIPLEDVIEEETDQLVGAAQMSDEWRKDVNWRRYHWMGTALLVLMAGSGLILKPRGTGLLYYLVAFALCMMAVVERFLNVKHATHTRYLLDHDALTGVKNVHMLEQKLSNRQNQQVTILLLSIDNFRMINDTCGVTEGDRLLQYFAALLQEAFGKEATYRYNGAQFLILPEPFEKTELEAQFADVSRKLSAYRVHYKKLRPTCSGSYITREYRSSSDFEQMIRRIDMKLYELQTFGKGHLAPIMAQQSDVGDT